MHSELNNLVVSTGIRETKVGCTKYAGFRTAADDQVVGLAGPDVLESQETPVPGQSADPHVCHGLTGLH